MPPAVELTAVEFQRLLDDLCVRLGFMLFAPDRDRLLPPSVEGVESFVESVFVIEGFDHPFDATLWQQTRDVVLAAMHRAAERPEHIDRFVLHTLANDLEGFEDILRLTNHPSIGWTDHLGRLFTPTDVLTSLLRLIRAGHVEACIESGSELVGAGERVVPDVPLEAMWYRMTSRGRLLHAAWTGGDPSPPGGGA